MSWPEYSKVTPTFVVDLLNKYDKFMAGADDRILSYPLMESPMPTLSLCLTYFIFVKMAGPKMMANRKPFDLRLPMIVYNFALVFLNGYLFWKFGQHGWFGKYDFRCQPVDRTNSPDALAMVNIGWLFYFSKFIEFADTIFFVLRKKQSQVTALHVLHHATMPFNVWFTIRFAPGGHSSFCSFLNSLVHVVMYLYYALAAIGPQMQPYIWWKRYITKMQLIQFVLVMGHSFQLLFRDCDYPKIFMAYIGFYAILFLFMFSDFYIKAYRKRASQCTVSKVEGVPLAVKKSL
ncbi:putative protein for very long chain fatty acid elongation [Halotydeus destructor]|nr:putative protein for very long chain fatty acid elongation [Halotydeus destructor]